MNKIIHEFCPKQNSIFILCDKDNKALQKEQILHNENRFAIVFRDNFRKIRSHNNDIYVYIVNTRIF